jgi:hypothetical protein
LIACRLLERPHVVEGGSCIFTEPVIPSVMGGKNQSVEDGFGSARLSGFISSSISAAVTIAVVWSDLFPKAYARRDVVQESPFDAGRSVISQRLTEGGAREGVRQRRMT